MPKAAKDAAADEKQIYDVIIALKGFIKPKFTLMKHLEENAKVYNNVRLRTNLRAYDIDKCFRQWKERDRARSFLEDF